MVKRIRSHNELVIAKVKASNPRETYAGLLWWAENKGFKRGWVFWKFQEIYSKRPKPLSPVQPEVPSNELREYIGIMKNRWKAKQKRAAAKHPEGCACWVCIIKLQQEVIEASDGHLESDATQYQTEEHPDT